MLAAIPFDYSFTVARPEHLFDEAREKLQAYLSQAENALASQNHLSALWAFRSAFALLLADFRRRDKNAQLPLVQRCSLFAELCRVWHSALGQMPVEQSDIAAMCRFIEAQRRRTEFFACA